MSENFIQSRIQEISSNFCPDYPEIQNVSSEEGLFAIESTMKGLEMANEDLHKLLDIVRKEYKIPENAILELAEKHI